MTVLVVDAENVRRSIWPNVALEELLELCGRHAEASSVELVVALDGSAPELETPAQVRLLAEPGRSADDLIVDVVSGAPRGTATVVTSDRGLRDRLEPYGASFVGGGTFVRDLLRRR